MQKITMNEFNLCRFVKRWTEIKNFVKENNLPHFQDGQTLIIITQLPTRLYSLFNGFSFQENFWNEKVMFKIDNEQFKASKPEYERFKEIHEYLILETS